MEVMPMGLGHVIDLMVAQVHAACGNFMQFGLPNVGPIFVDQGDLRASTATIGMPQTGGQFKTTSPATHDDDSVLLTHVLPRKRALPGKLLHPASKVNAKPPRK
jgi:hypothetical protein